MGIDGISRLQRHHIQDVMRSGLLHRIPFIKQAKHLRNKLWLWILLVNSNKLVILGHSNEAIKTTSCTMTSGGSFLAPIKGNVEWSQFQLIDGTKAALDALVNRPITTSLLACYLKFVAQTTVGKFRFCRQYSRCVASILHNKDVDRQGKEWS